jgi:hypothetical protein
MAAFNKRRNGDGSTSWDAAVSVVGYPRTSKSFRSKLAAELWAARTEDARRGRTPTSRRGMTLRHLLDEALPRLTNPTTAVFDYWRAELGDVQLMKISPELIALHRDRLLGAACRGHRHKSETTLASDGAQLSDRARAAVLFGGQGTPGHGHQSLRECHEAKSFGADCALAFRR